MKRQNEDLYSDTVNLAVIQHLKEDLLAVGRESAYCPISSRDSLFRAINLGSQIIFAGALGTLQQVVVKIAVDVKMMIAWCSLANPIQSLERNGSLFNRK